MVILREFLLYQCYNRPHRLCRILPLHKEKIAVLSIGKIRRFPFVDPVCIQNNPAGLRLPENPGQPHHRNAAGIHHIPQHVPGADTGKLIHISDHNQCHSIRHRLQKVIHQQDIDHRAFIYNQHIPAQRIVFFFLIALHRAVFQQPVDGFCFHFRRFRKPLGCPAGRRCQQDLCACHFKRRHNPQRGRGFSRPRPAGQNQDSALHGGKNRPYLDLIVIRSRTHPDCLFQAVCTYMNPSAVLQNTGQPLRHAAFRIIKRREINRLRRRICPGICFRIFRRIFRGILREILWDLLRNLLSSLLSSLLRNLLRNLLRDHILLHDHLIQRL